MKGSSARDPKKGVEWCRKAADQGHDEAQYNLGLCYVNGDGVAKDVAEAEKWFRKAAAQGDELAKAALQRLGQSP